MSVRQFFFLPFLHYSSFLCSTVTWLLLKSGQRYFSLSSFQINTRTYLIPRLAVLVCSVGEILCETLMKRWRDTRWKISETLVKCRRNVAETENLKLKCPSFGVRCVSVGNSTHCLFDRVLLRRGLQPTYVSTCNSGRVVFVVSNRHFPFTLTKYWALFWGRHWEVFWLIIKLSGLTG